ncbi:MAG: M20/M25/M40 family metallo-hydrolase [Proteobacteria bacterium]|nr:M20/M25/M40 family metallo-hydrolase [Pseudomonadota bacterium]MCP4918589.1 M20/M25/M40 family metallo-hydrolase [Pseudomonadota bacterium]
MLFLLLSCTGANDISETPVDSPVDSASSLPAADPIELGLEVSQENLTAHIAALEGFGTRYTMTSGNADAQLWLIQQLEDQGYLVEEDPFSFGQKDAVNLVARKEGAVDPDAVWILSAHYDSTSTDPESSAPGADDNASGVAVLLEAARILKDVETNDSVWFVLTGAEEQGSKGSAHMADWLTSQGVQVQGVMAPDMVGYWPLGEDDAMDILGDDESEHLVQDMAAVADAMGVANKTWIFHYFCYGDDHTNFQEAGIPAISPMDCVEAHNVYESGEETPHYHQTSDTLDTLHMPFTTKVGQVMVATVAGWAEPI